MPKTDRRYIILLTPNGKYTDIKVIQLKENKIDLDQMYKLINCRCISIGYPYEKVDSKVLKIKPLVVFDDEFLLTEENPVVNYVASIFVGYTLCGKTLIVKDSGEDMIPFSLKEVTAIYNYTLGINSLSETFADIKVPSPKFSVKSFETAEELEAIMKGEK